MLAEQLASTAPGTRLDTVRMGELMRTWRGDHTRFLMLAAGQLTTDDPEVAAEAALRRRHTRVSLLLRVALRGWLRAVTDG
ncbi:hypothetical protein [Streptomyces sp. NPDC102476]|uniref:hypothetical protein n=1 Tax=Streptomyces sp. NPDC102476 TaxID=3366181 RepID=UPI0037F130C8